MRANFHHPRAVGGEPAAGLPSATVSQVLNERLRKNFYDFVNGFRVEEAKRILRDPRRSDQSGAENVFWGLLLLGRERKENHFPVREQ